MPTDELCNAIENNFLPLVIIDPGSSPESLVQLRVLQREMNMEAQPKYVAISHVCADGRGNPDHNALPACQLRFLYSACELNPNLPIWMDTLCIPPVNGPQRHASLRQIAIRDMNDIYLQATNVTLVSNDLLDVKFQASFPHDIWLQVQTNAWMR